MSKRNPKIFCVEKVYLKNCKSLKSDYHTQSQNAINLTQKYPYPKIRLFKLHEPKNSNIIHKRRSFSVILYGDG